MTQMHKDEELVDQALHDLPLRRAPATLELRVVQALQQRRASPWWRSGFGSWPVGARVAFYLLCSVTVALTALTGPLTHAASLWQSASAATLTWLQPLIAPAATVIDLAAALLRLIPANWWYGALAFAGVFYAALFGLGAAAYRTLYFRPDSRGLT